MATAAMIPLEEYLKTSYEHDCEWIDGVVRERAMPDDFHSAVQQFFLAYFQSLRRELGVWVRPELRLRVAPRKYRIPDVMLMPTGVRPKPIPDVPPVLCIEVLSPDDKAGELQEKLDDYVVMGVAAIWIVDPRRRKLFTADAHGIHTVESFLVPNSRYVIYPTQIFEEIDSYSDV